MITLGMHFLIKGSFLIQHHIKMLSQSIKQSCAALYCMVEWSQTNTSQKPIHIIKQNIIFQFSVRAIKHNHNFNGIKAVRLPLCILTVVCDMIREGNTIAQYLTVFIACCNLKWWAYISWCWQFLLLLYQALVFPRNFAKIFMSGLQVLTWSSALLTTFDKWGASNLFYKMKTDI